MDHAQYEYLCDQSTSCIETNKSCENLLAHLVQSLPHDHGLGVGTQAHPIDHAHANGHNVLGVMRRVCEKVVFKGADLQN